MMEPFLRYVGSKRLYLDKIRKYFPSGKDLYHVELFLGSASLLLDMQPKRGILNDANVQLMNCYRVISSNPEDLMRKLDKHQQLDSKNHFERVKQKYNEIKQRGELPMGNLAINMASFLVYMNARCYNGLYRENSRGEFNVSYDPNRKRKNLYDKENLLKISRFLKSGEFLIVNDDYKIVFERYKKEMDKNAFFLLDPPYLSTKGSNSSFTKYVSDWDLLEYDFFVKFVKDLDKSGYAFLLFNSDSNYIRKAFKSDKFNIYTYQVKRHVNCKPELREKLYNELIITNYDMKTFPSLMQY